MFIKVSTLFAAIAALASTTASSLVTRSCSGKTPYVILRVDEWMHIDVLDKDPHQPLHQWGDWGVFTKSFNFSTHDQYYREHFVATSYVENGVWDRENPDNLVEKAKLDCVVEADEGIDQKFCGDFIYLYRNGTIENQAEGDGKGGTVRAGCTLV